MRQELSERTRSMRRKGGIAIAAILALMAFTAAPAQAGGNEFDDGFQDQLGRLVASEVFHLGKWVLAGGPHYVHHDYRPSHYEPRPHRGHGYARHYRHKRRHYRHDRGHHHGHGHRYDAPCNVETHERVRRDRHGDVVEYERHEVRYRDRYARRW